MRRALGVAAVLLAALTFISAKPLNYIERLFAFEGIPYYELSCSQYIMHAARHSDCLADCVWDGAHGEMELVADYPTLRAIDYSTLNPGDVAAFHGVHVVAYLGDGLWMDSDPQHNGVARIRLEDKNKLDPWFSGRVRILRWKTLADGGPIPTCNPDPGPNGSIPRCQGKQPQNKHPKVTG